jgi:uncharacterized caspase-like protein
MPYDNPMIGLSPDLSGAITTQMLLDALDIPGRKLIFIDACHSGGVDTNRLVRTLKTRSIAIFSASQQSELAQERDDWGGGAFTTSIVEGLDGEALVNGSISLINLADFVSDNVRFLTRRGMRQRPNIILPTGLRDFILAQ